MAFWCRSGSVFILVWILFRQIRISKSKINFCLPTYCFLFLQLHVYVDQSRSYPSSIGRQILLLQFFVLMVPTYQYILITSGSVTTRIRFRRKGADPDPQHCGIWIFIGSKCWIRIRRNHMHIRNTVRYRTGRLIFSFY